MTTDYNPLTPEQIEAAGKEADCALLLKDYSFSMPAFARAIEQAAIENYLAQKGQLGVLEAWKTECIRLIDCFNDLVSPSLLTDTVVVHRALNRLVSHVQKLAATPAPQDAQMGKDAELLSDLAIALAEQFGADHPLVQRADAAICGTQNVPIQTVRNAALEDAAQIADIAYPTTENKYYVEYGRKVAKHIAACIRALKSNGFSRDVALEATCEETPQDTSVEKDAARFRAWATGTPLLFQACYRATGSGDQIGRIRAVIDAAIAAAKEERK